MSKAILVVEDDDVVRMLTTEVLEEFGYQVLGAEDGEEALSTLSSDTHIDLLLTDVGLPGMSGPELARQALTLRPELAVLFASGYVQGEQLADLGEAGGISLRERCQVIGKPFSLDQIRDKVAGMIGV
jgi:CheY-like chemotaxis protein